MQPDIQAWRPQAFGRRKPKELHDPVVEPAWDGVRVLAHFDGGEIRIVDAAGVELDTDQPGIVEALQSTARAGTIVVDGYLTDQASRSGVGVVLAVDESPGIGEHMAQFMLGKRGAELVGGRGRLPGTASARTLHDAEAAAAAGSLPIVFVAVDLLEVDGSLLLDVPLLERKRLLESVVPEGDLVRLTPFVREPAVSFVSSWRAAGFGGLAYKAANSHYRPGEPNDDWSLIDMPRR